MLEEQIDCPPLTRMLQRQHCPIVHALKKAPWTGAIMDQLSGKLQDETVDKPALVAATTELADAIVAQDFEQARALTSKHIGKTTWVVPAAGGYVGRAEAKRASMAADDQAEEAVRRAAAQKRKEADEADHNADDIAKRRRAATTAQGKDLEKATRTLGEERAGQEGCPGEDRSRGPRRRAPREGEEEGGEAEGEGG